ncbi:MAG: hypothetical protein ACC628_22600, partial [Pirellulaceae bacterium]
VFRFSLHTASGGFLASFPTPTLTAEWLPAEELHEGKATATETPPAEGTKPTRQPVSPAREIAPRADKKAKVKNREADQLCEVLFILRNLKEAPKPPAEKSSP